MLNRRPLFIMLLLFLLTGISQAQLNWTWYIHSTNVTGGSPGTFDLTVGIKANSGGDVGDLGNFNIRGTMSSDLYDFTGGATDPEPGWATGSYSTGVTNPSGTYNWQLNGAVSAGSGSNVTTGGIPVATVRFYIQTPTGSSNINLGSLQQTFQDDNITAVSVSYNNTGGDVPLPVLMSNMYTEVSAEKGVIIYWNTESEVNTAGYHVWRRSQNEGEYVRITTDLIPSMGTGSAGNPYSYSDINVEEGVLYFYLIQEISLSGGTEFFGPVIATGVNIIPREFDLESNYPNPFNPETKFWFDVPEESDVTIKVYSLLGREVKTLYDGYKAAGRFELKWNGKDELGDRVSSGIYLLRMQAGTFSKVRKMTLVR